MTGEPCKNKGTWWASTHWQRRKAARESPGGHVTIQVQVVPGAEPPIGYTVSLALPPSGEREGRQPLAP